MKSRILKRQLQSTGLEKGVCPADLKNWQAFLERVERAYGDAEQERYLLERSLQISSREMQERWQLIETERSRAIQAVKMAALGEMAGGVAHEINNPLAVVQLLAAQAQELLQESPIDKTQLQDHLEKIEQTATRIAKIVQGLRTFSRDGGGDPFVPHKLSEIVNDTLALCSERFHHQEIKLTVDPIPDSASLNCRPALICQALINLLNNASDAIEQETSKWIQIRITFNEGEVNISITDSGPGIPADTLQKLFQPFFTTKEFGKGTGLGLSITKGIIDDHGGSLSVDEKNPNTCFVIRLPCLL